MKTLDVILYITQHPYHKYYIVIKGEIEGHSQSPLDAIMHFASIDPSWYDEFRWDIKPHETDFQTFTISR